MIQLHNVVKPVSVIHRRTEHCPSRLRRGSGLDCGSEDPGAISGLPSLRVGRLMARRLKLDLCDKYNLQINER